MPYKDKEKRREYQRVRYQNLKDRNKKTHVEIRLSEKDEKLSTYLDSCELYGNRPNSIWIKAGRAVPLFTVESTLTLVGVSRPTLLRWEETYLVPRRTVENVYTRHQVELLICLAEEIKRNTKGRSGIDKIAIQSTVDRTYKTWTAIDAYPTLSEAFPSKG